MRITSLWLYPLKSARGVALDAAEVEARGLAGDRRWMIVDAEGRFISQREAPELAQLSATPVSGGLRLGHAERGAIEVATPPPDAARIAVRVWSDQVRAAPASAEAGEWLGAFLGRPCQLVHLPDDELRPVDPDFGAPGDRVSFADAFPLLVATEDSLRDLEGRLDQPLPMQRFRPNLVIDGAGAFGEDAWRRIRIGQVSLRVVKACDRCVITTTDQETGARGVEPLRTLAGYRRRDGKVLFGQNAIPDGPGLLRVGDEVEVLEAAPAGR